MIISSLRSLKNGYHFISKYKILILGFFILIPLLSCRTPHPNLFQHNKPLEQKLLPLEIHIIDENRINLKNYEIKSRVFPVERVLETRYFIKNEFKQNIFNKDYSEPYGYLICEIQRGGSVNWAWFVVSTCSLYAINFTGFPLFSLSAETSINIEILDSNLNTIKTYYSKSKDTEHAAFYWGYYAEGGGSTQYDSCINQAVHINALSKTIEKLKGKIQKDALMINGKLEVAGKIS